MRALSRGIRMPRWRFLLLAVIFVASCLFYRRGPVSWQTKEPEPEYIVYNYDLDPYTPAYSGNLSVNLVIASLSTDDISWTTKLRIPNLRVIRYISDSTDAEFRPPVPRKGREALIYHTYFHDFYDELPDVSIMIHADDRPWHLEPALNRSLPFALEHLDLDLIRAERPYFNLRASWLDACPEWLDTTKTPETAEKQEEPYMRPAFMETFGPAVVIPDKLAGPCCSQFAVTREAIRRHPQSAYKHIQDWFLTTEWSDYIAGRVWEHMWPYLLKGEAIDCEDEWATYCRVYGLCYKEPHVIGMLNGFAKERRIQEERTEFWRAIFNPFGAIEARKRLLAMEKTMQKEVSKALERGRVQKPRILEEELKKAVAGVEAAASAAASALAGSKGGSKGRSKGRD